MSIANDKIANILRADKDTVSHIDSNMSKHFGRQGVLNDIYEENKKKIDAILKKEGIKDHSARDMYNALIGRVQKDDLALRKILDNPICGTEHGCQIIVDGAFRISRVGQGLFMKWERAADFLRANPPKNIMAFFGYKTVDELLKKEDIKKVYSALRFAEDKEWLNKTFFKEYDKLTADDFERRYIEAFVMGDKWVKMAEKFMKKKYHNVSHLKELGVIFVLPERLGVYGEVLRLFSLVLHYMHEIEFYSQLFIYYSENEKKDAVENKSFDELFISALRGDVLDERLADEKQINWMIVQRYLAKDDEHDWRLFEPHVNPEALHWSRAEENIAHLGENIEGLDLSFWRGLDCIGDFYKSDTGIDVLVSFNLIDTVMSLVQKKELIKYLYHHQEALWNKIFMSYVGEEEMRSLIIKNFHKGYINI